MKQFGTFEDAFDIVRHLDRPLTVFVGSEKWKIFPSGHAVPKNRAAIEAGVCDGYLKVDSRGRVTHV